MNYWSKETNLISGEYIEEILKYLRWANNDSGNMDDFISSPYGEQFAIRLDREYRYGLNSMGAETKAFYEGMGLKRLLFDDEHFYTRWVLLVPLDADTQMGKDRRYPLVIVNRAGNDPVERTEFSTGFNEIAGREGFMVLYPQNTDPAYVEKLLERVSREFPVDRERVYVTGYSSGGQQTTAAAFAFPEKLAAHAPCGNDIYRNMNLAFHVYTKEEEERLKKARLPFMQTVGCCEHSNIVPLNQWKPKLFKGGGRMFLNLPTDPRAALEQDPTDVAGGKFAAPKPPEDADTRVWMVEQLNRRLDLLGCAPREIGKCLAFADAPEDELHHMLGFYGDREKIRSYYGYKHYTVDIFSEDHINMFRYSAVENSPHSPGVMMGELVWEFFRQFRRDSVTGEIVEEEYRYSRW